MGADCFDIAAPADPPRYDYRYHDPGFAYNYPPQNYAYPSQPSQAPQGQYTQPNGYVSPYPHPQPSYAQYQPQYYADPRTQSSWPQSQPQPQPQPQSQPQLPPYPYDQQVQQHEPASLTSAYIQELTMGSKRKNRKQTVEPSMSKRQKSSPITPRAPLAVIVPQTQAAVAPAPSHPIATPSVRVQEAPVAEPSYAKENLPPTPASSVTPSRHEVVDLTSPQPVPSKVQPLPPKPTGPSHQQHMESMAAAKALSRAAALGHCDLPTSASPISRPNFRISSAAAKDGPIMLDSHGQVTADPSKARSYIARPPPALQASLPVTPITPRIHTSFDAPPSSYIPLSSQQPSPFNAPPSSYIPLSSQDPPSSQPMFSSPHPSSWHVGTQPSKAPKAAKAPKAPKVKPGAGPIPMRYDEPEPPLCAEQEDLVRLILSGRNVFYTGSAGCGKSTVLKAFTKRLRAMGKKVQIVAPTGRAALQVNGQTTWTYAGWTPDRNKDPMKKILEAAHGKFTWDRFNKKTDVLVIDEISMVNFHFHRLNELLKEARHQPHEGKKPFGGLQVIVTGDFCQLPPVKPFQYCVECGLRLIERYKSGGKIYTCKKHGDYRDEDKWAFRSQAWEECNFVHVELTQIHRQSDQLFISLLQKCRKGFEFTPEDIDILMNHKNKVNRRLATQLHATRAKVKEVNDAAFAKLTNVTHTFWSLDAMSLEPKHPHLAFKGKLRMDAGAPESRRPLIGLDDHRYENCVRLKQGMLIVLLINLDLGAGLCNGSQGLVCGWEKYDPNKMPKAKWGKNEEPGPGMKINGDRALTKERQVKNFIEGDAIQVKFWPKVRFLNGTIRTIYADCSITEIGDEEPYSLLMRTQIPLAPAWAMTIHKSQGMTLDQVIVDLSRAFEEGQVYVALSRAKSLEGLKIDGDKAGLQVGLGGNREVQRFLREKFGSAVGRKEEMVGAPPSSQPGFFFDLGPGKAFPEMKLG